MDKLIKRLRKSVKSAETDGENMDVVSWGMQEGILITYNEAKQIVELYQSHVENHYGLFAQKDISFLKEMKERIEKYQDVKDFEELEMVNQMIDDWLDELMQQAVVNSVCTGTVYIDFKELYPTYKEWIEEVNCQINLEHADVEEHIDEQELRDEYENETDPCDIANKINDMLDETK